MKKEPFTTTMIRTQTRVTWALIFQLTSMKSRLPSMYMQLAQLDKTRMEQMRLVGMKKALSDSLSPQMLEILKGNIFHGN